MNYLELQQEAARQGFRLEPITKLDDDRSLFSRCESQEDVQAVLDGLPSGYAVEPRAMPTVDQLLRNRQIKMVMRMRGIDPDKPVVPMFTQ